MAPDGQNNDNLELLLEKTENGICELVLNRPDKRNPLSTAMLKAIENSLLKISKEKTIKVVILSANGPVFSAGHDLKEMRANTNYKFIHELFLQCSRTMLQITRLPQPVIAKVNGIATAAGCQLVASCDLAIASDKSKFGTPGGTNGLFCATPAVAVGRAIERKHAMEMLLMGELISAEEAYRFGMVNKVVPEDMLDDPVRSYASSIASRSTLTMSLGKQAFYRQLDMDVEAAYNFSSEVMAKNMMEHDAQEGIDAFLEKREAFWRGR